MNVTLEAVTQPVQRLVDQGIKTPEDFIVYCARVSNPSNQLNTETGDRLLNYCIKHQHWSIFEQASCTFKIETSRAIAAQILRHRSFTFQEFSQRYAETQELEPVEWRMQGKTNRQVGDEVVKLPQHLKDDFTRLQWNSKSLYNRLIAEGVAKECARMVLPLNTQTTLYMSGTIRSFIHYIQLRAKEDTQKEHREIASEMKKIFCENFSVIAKALEWSIE